MSTNSSVTSDFVNLLQTELDHPLSILLTEITFIDENYTVRYFNNPLNMIFIRTKKAFGRKVQNCRFAKSLDAVSKIIECFKSCKKDKAEVLIDLHDRMIYIRFLAIRAEGGDLATIEVIQDAAETLVLQGEKRLLGGQE